MAQVWRKQTAETREQLRAASDLLGSFQDLPEFFLKLLVARCDMPLDEHCIPAIEVSDEATRLAHHQQAGRHVPRRQVALPVDVEPAGRDRSEVERGGAESA